MKKIIIIAAILLVAIVGLTSYNGREEKKSEGKNGNMLAQLNTGGNGLSGQTQGGKKLE